MSNLQLNDFVWLKSTFPIRGLPQAATDSPVKRSISNKSAANSDEASGSGATTQMKCFAKLPLEIRQEIWFLSACAPRVIEITGYVSKKTGSRKLRELRMTSNALVPAIMHACVDSRNAGMKIYQPLNLSRFTGTYINWANDYIMFKKTPRGKKSVEEIYMTYEGDLLASIPNCDLVLNVERLAVSPTNLNDFVRVQSDLDGQIEKDCPGHVLVYPKLKEVAAVECWPSWEEETQHLSIRPKVLMPVNLPNYFCPLSPFNFTDGVRVVQNRWHQEVNWMRIIPGKGELLLPADKPKTTAVIAQPKAPERLPGLSRFSAIKLQQFCRARNLDEAGTRQDLISRLRASEDVVYPLAMDKYKDDLKTWASCMLGHADPMDGEKYSLEVQNARAEAVKEYLIEKGFRDCI